MIDLGEFMVVTSALTGRRVLINKMAVVKITEPSQNSSNILEKFCNIHFDPDMVVATSEKFDDLIEAFTTEELEDFT